MWKGEIHSQDKGKYSHKGRIISGDMCAILSLKLFKILANITFPKTGGNLSIGVIWLEQAFCVAGASFVCTQLFDFKMHVQRKTEFATQTSSLSLHLTHMQTSTYITCASPLTRHRSRKACCAASLFLSSPFHTFRQLHNEIGLRSCVVSQTISCQIRAWCMPLSTRTV